MIANPGKSDNPSEGGAARSARAGANGTAVPPRPVALPVLFDAIPAELRALNQWVVWKYEFRDERWTKPPFAAKTGRAASSTDPSTWCTFAEARAAYAAGGWDGVGLVHLHDNRLVGVDLDHCRNRETGVVQEWAGAIVATMDTYSEVSPSGTGLRIFAFGRKPGRDCKKGNTEIYDGLTRDRNQGGRFLTLTGCRLDGMPATINDRQAQVEALYRETFGQQRTRKKKRDKASSEPDPSERTHERNSRTTFDDLPPHVQAALAPLLRDCANPRDNDRSRADFALCCEAIRRGVGKQVIWEKLQVVGKTAKRGRGYFDNTWEKAEAAVNSEGNQNAPSGGGAATGKSACYPLGKLTVQAGKPRQTPCKLIVPVEAFEGARRVYTGQIASVDSSRRGPAKTLATLASVEVSEADSVLIRLVADAKTRMESQTEPDGPTIHDVVAKRLPASLALTHRTARGVWSEAFSREITRGDFLGQLATSLLEACAEAGDGPDSRHNLIKAVETELKVVWADLMATLPSEENVDLGEATAAGRRFRAAIIAVWTRPRLLERERTAQGAEVGRSASLVSRIRRPAHEYLDGVTPVELRERWREIHPAYAAWWRPYSEQDGGQVRIALAMRHDLAGAIGVDLPECNDQASMRRIGERYRCFAGEIATADGMLPHMLSGGVHRLAVLSPELVNELICWPMEDGEDAHCEREVTEAEQGDDRAS